MAVPGAHRIFSRATRGTEAMGVSCAHRTLSRATRGTEAMAVPGVRALSRASRGAARRSPAAAGLLALALLVLVPAAPAPAQTGSAPAIQFLPDEEALFRDFLARDPAPPVALPEAPAVGTMIPLAIPLQAFPGSLMALVPATRGLRYLRTPAGIVAVDPDTRRAVQILGLAQRP